MANPPFHDSPLTKYVRQSAISRVLGDRLTGELADRMTSFFPSSYLHYMPNSSTFILPLWAARPIVKWLTG
jgi:hypothetical protein